LTQLLKLEIEKGTLMIFKVNYMLFIFISSFFNIIELLLFLKIAEIRLYTIF